MPERKFASISRWTKFWRCGQYAEKSYRIRYPDPAIKVNDTVKIDLATGKISDFIQFDTGVIAMATGGRNMGRVGVITHRERHDGGFNIVHIKDAVDNEFATRESNVFVIGREKPWISLPKGKGVKVRPSRALCVGIQTNKIPAFHCRGERSPSGVRHCWPLDGQNDVSVLDVSNCLRIARLAKRRHGRQSDRSGFEISRATPAWSLVAFQKIQFKKFDEPRTDIRRVDLSSVLNVILPTVCTSLGKFYWILLLPTANSARHSTRVDICSGTREWLVVKAHIRAVIM